MVNNFFCTVKIAGEVVEPLHYINFTDIKFRLDEVRDDSSGAIFFSSPVNLTFLKDNFDSFFDVYVKNNSYRTHKTY